MGISSMGNKKVGRDVRANAPPDPSIERQD